jgi:hypothetical protein
MRATCFIESTAQGPRRWPKCHVRPWDCRHKLWKKECKQVWLVEPTAGGTGPGRATNVIDLLVAGEIGEKAEEHIVYCWE